MGRSLLALLLILVACGGDETATDQNGSTDYPDASLEITYEHPETASHTYSVTCSDDTARLEGAELDGEAACTALSDLQVRSRLLDGPADRACTEIYGGPETALIRGTIDGQDVDTVIDRTDGCGISDWDNLLSELLPPPRELETES